jgi:hypothetical protein
LVAPVAIDGGDSEVLVLAEVVTLIINLRWPRGGTMVYVKVFDSFEIERGVR